MAPVKSLKKLNTLGAGTTRSLKRLAVAHHYKVQGLRAVVTPEFGRSIVADLEEHTKEGSEEFTSFLPKVFGRRFTDVDVQELEEETDPLYMVIRERIGNTHILHFTNAKGDYMTPVPTTTAPPTPSTD